MISYAVVFHVKAEGLFLRLKDKRKHGQIDIIQISAFLFPFLLIYGYQPFLLLATFSLPPSHHCAFFLYIHVIILSNLKLRNANLCLIHPSPSPFRWRQGPHTSMLVGFRCSISATCKEDERWRCGSKPFSLHGVSMVQKLCLNISVTHIVFCVKCLCSFFFFFFFPFKIMYIIQYALVIRFFIQFLLLSIIFSKFLNLFS